MEDINLHFTGDFARDRRSPTTCSRRCIDNHIHQGNELGFDVRRITWRRVVDMNDRALRHIVDRPRRHRQRRAARGRLRHRGGLRGHGDLLPGDAASRISRSASATSWSATVPTSTPILARDLQGARRHDGAAEERAGAEPGADAREQPGLHPRRPVRQHRARLQLGDRDPHRAQARRLRGHRGRLRRRPRCREVHRHQMPQGGPEAPPPRSWSRRCARSSITAACELADLKSGEPARRSSKGLVNLERHIDNVRNHYGLPCVVAINRSRRGHRARRSSC